MLKEFRGTVIDTSKMSDNDLEDLQKEIRSLLSGVAFEITMRKKAKRKKSKSN